MALLDGKAILIAFLALILPLRMIAVVAASSPFVSYSPAFSSILGTNPELNVLLNVSLPLFHEAGIYHSPTRSLFAVTDTINDPSINNNKSIQLLVHITNLEQTPPTYEFLNISNLPNPTSGVRYTYNGTDMLAILATGNSKNSPPGGLFLLNPYPPFERAIPLTTSYGPYPYNSPNDVTVLPSGDIYFTDPIYGLYTGARSAVYLPNQVYLYSPTNNGTTRVVADGFGRPNGITHSPDGSTVYISDTGASIGNGSTDYQGQRSVYAYSITNNTIGGITSSRLTDRYVFAMPDVGAADGLKTDTKGNVWGFSIDGLHIWDKAGNVLGKILLDGGTGNFGFAEAGEIYVMGSNVLYRLKLDPSVMGTGV